MSESTRRSGRKRVAILEAAREHFLRHGFPATSMDRIAESASVSKRTVYNHFESKEALFTEIVSEAVEKWAEFTQLTFEANRPLKEQLLDYCSRKTELFSTPHHLGLVRVMIAAWLQSPELAERIFAKVDIERDDLTGWIVAARDAGKLQVADVALAAAQLTALIKGQLFWPHVLGLEAGLGATRSLEIIAPSLDMFLAHYGS